jgi:hypothetical protein
MRSWRCWRAELRRRCPALGGGLRVYVNSGIEEEGLGGEARPGNANNVEIVPELRVGSTFWS